MSAERMHQNTAREVQRTFVRHRACEVVAANEDCPISFTPGSSSTAPYRLRRRLETSPAITIEGMPNQSLRRRRKARRA
jgi:hypothetical protein